MNLRKRQAVRLPDYERLVHAVYDFEALELSRLKLENHFKKNLPILLVGSFVRTDSHSSGAGKAPSDIDMRIISPAATAQDYVPDMAFASILRNSGQLAATFMVVPSDYSDAFFLSNTSDKPLDAASTILLGAPYSFSVLADGEERPFMLSKTVRTMFNLRAALAKVETYKASAQLKSQLNIPYYALKILRGIFGKIEGVSARKFTEEDTHQCNALYDFVEANISMQKVIDAYGEHLEKDMRN